MVFDNMLVQNGKHVLMQTDQKLQKLPDFVPLYPFYNMIMEYVSVTLPRNSWESLFHTHVQGEDVVSAASGWKCFLIPAVPDSSQWHESRQVLVEMCFQLMSFTGLSDELRWQVS